MPVGNRRMINPQVTESGMFLMMPPSTQALYFHLCTHADDDGIVEAYTVMRMTGSKEDDMAILISKRFVTVLDKDIQVIWINHWNDHNNIRPELVTPSAYRELLVSIVPDAYVKESKKADDTRRRVESRRAKKMSAADTTRTLRGSAAGPQRSIVELSIAKESRDSNSYVAEATEEVEEMTSLWKTHAGGTVRNFLEENLKDFRYLKGELGTELTLYLQAIRMIRADQFQKRTLQAKLINYMGLRERLEEVEAYMQSKVDGTAVNSNTAVYN